MATPIPVILDMDPGVDDALAIIFAPRLPEMDVRVHDPLAVASVVNTSVLTTLPVRVDIETGDDALRGTALPFEHRQGLLFRPIAGSPDASTPRTVLANS